MQGQACDEEKIGECSARESYIVLTSLRSKLLALGKKFPFSKQDSANTNIGRGSNIRGLSEWLDETWILRNINGDKPVPPCK